MLKKARFIILSNMCLLSINGLHAMETEPIEQPETTIIDILQARGIPLHLIARIGYYLPGSIENYASENKEDHLRLKLLAYTYDTYKDERQKQKENWCTTFLKKEFNIPDDTVVPIDPELFQQLAADYKARNILHPLYTCYDTTRKNRIEYTKKDLDEALPKIDNPKIATILLEHGANPNATNDQGDTSLHCAALYGRADNLTTLLEHGADPNIQENILQRTPLHIAARYGYADCLKELLEYGADPNIQENVLQQTPLHTAAYHGCADNLTILLEHGANPNIKDLIGRTPLDIAINRNDTECIQILREYSTTLDTQENAPPSPKHLI